VIDLLIIESLSRPLHPQRPRQIALQLIPEVRRLFMRTHVILAILILFTFDAEACQPIAPIPSAEELVAAADVIVRAEAIAVERLPGAIREPSFENGFGRVTLAVKEVLKGSFVPETMTVTGYFESVDDANDRPVPYDYVRPGGRHGNCYALSYRLGAEYLLMVKKVDRSVIPTGTELSPYWSPLAPTNEQILEPRDPWLAWVRDQL